MLAYRMSQLCQDQAKPSAPNKLIDSIAENEQEIKNDESSRDETS